MTTRDWSWNSGRTPDSTCTWSLWPGLGSDLHHQEAQTGRWVSGQRRGLLGSLADSWLSRCNPAKPNWLLQPAIAKWHHRKAKVAIKPSRTRRNDLSVTKINPRLNITPNLNTDARKPRGKSASLLIIATHPHRWQHPSAPRMRTWPTTARRIQSTGGLPVAPVRVPQKQWEEGEGLKWGSSHVTS